jgi:site-specific recombinase XerD
VWAVEKYRKTSLKRVQTLLGHSDEAITVLYAMADQITAKKLKNPAP